MVRAPSGSAMDRDYCSSSGPGRVGVAVNAGSSGVGEFNPERDTLVLDGICAILPGRFTDFDPETPHERALGPFPAHVDLHCHHGACCAN